MKTLNHFMVIDDDASNNLLCEFTIRRFFGETNLKIYKEPETALKAIEEKYMVQKARIGTVVFLDLYMPSCNGWEFLESFKYFDANIHEQVSIYILTSSVNERDIQKAKLNPLVSGFLSKPLTVDGLRQIFVKDNKIQLLVEASPLVHLNF
jgi:CheY-like chemotaxis protein